MPFSGYPAPEPSRIDQRKDIHNPFRCTTGRFRPEAVIQHPIECMHYVARMARIDRPELPCDYRRLRGREVDPSRCAGRARLLRDARERSLCPAGTGAAQRFPLVESQPEGIHGGSA